MLLPKNKMLIRRIESAKVTPGGLEIPTQAQKKENRANVLMTGPGIKDELLIDINPGDQIIFGKYSGREILIDNEEHLIMGVEEVLLVIPESEAEENFNEDCCGPGCGCK